MPVVTSQILKFVDFIKIQKSRYLENETLFFLHIKKFIDTRVYNLISFPQISGYLLGDAMISSKTEPRNGSKKEKRSYSKVRNNKTLKIL